MKEKCEDDVELNDQETNMPTGRSASNRRHSNGRETALVSREEYIKQLQAEIDMLKSDSGRSSKYQRVKHYREGTPSHWTLVI